MYGVLTAVIFPLSFLSITAYCLSFNMTTIYEATTVLRMQQMNMYICAYIYLKVLFSFYFFTSLSLFKLSVLKIPLWVRGFFSF